MGALAPVLTSTLLSQGLGLITSELGRQKSRGSQDLALQQLQSQQRLQEQQLSATAVADREKLALTSKNAEADRKAALRRAVSRQRASFGSQGIGSGAGSSQAVLLGLFEESDDEKSRREGLDNLRVNSIDQSLSNRSSLNVLQRTQLEERNKLNSISAGRNLVKGLFGF